MQSSWITGIHVQATADRPDVLTWQDQGNEISKLPQTCLLISRSSTHQAGVLSAPALLPDCKAAYGGRPRSRQVYFLAISSPFSGGRGEGLLKIDHNVQDFSHFQDTGKYLLLPACAYKYITICKIRALMPTYLGVDRNLLDQALGIKSAPA